MKVYRIFIPAVVKHYRFFRCGVAPAAVLHLLARGEMTGYDLVTALARGGEAALPEGEGGGYALLHHLKARKLIDARLDKSDGLPQLLYRLTDKGRKRQQKMQYHDDRLKRILGDA